MCPQCFIVISRLLFSLSFSSILFGFCFVLFLPERVWFFVVHAMSRFTVPFSNLAGTRHMSSILRHLYKKTAYVDTRHCTFEQGAQLCEKLDLHKYLCTKVSVWHFRYAHYAANERRITFYLKIN